MIVKFCMLLETKGPRQQTKFDPQPTNQPTNQPTTNDQRRHDTAYLKKRLFY